MNANEVIATLAGDDVHANDDVNMGQSSNDVFPSAVHLAALDEIDERPAAGARPARRVARGEGEGVRRRRQVGPHALDGRGAGHARPGVRRLRRAGARRASRACATRCRGSARSRSAAPPIGTGLNTHPEFAARVRARPARGDRSRDLAAGRPVRGAGGARRPRRGLGRAQGRRRLADEDRERHPLHGLRPARRARRDLRCPSCRRAARSCPARSTPSSRRS